MSNPSRLEKPIIEARKTLELPGMITETVRNVDNVNFLSRKVRVNERNSTKWIDAGEYPSILNQQGANLRVYQRLVEHTEWDAKRRLFVPVNLGDIALSEIDEESSNTTIAVQRGFGPGRLRFPPVLDSVISIGIIELQEKEVATGDTVRFMKALDGFNEVAGQQQVAA